MYPHQPEQTTFTATPGDLLHAQYGTLRRIDQVMFKATAGHLVNQLPSTAPRGMSEVVGATVDSIVPGRGDTDRFALQSLAGSMALNGYGNDPFLTGRVVKAAQAASILVEGQGFNDLVPTWARPITPVNQIPQR